MRIFRYIILALVLLNIPSFVLVYGNPGISSILSYTSFFLLLIFYLLNKRVEPNIWMIGIGLSYFVLSVIAGQNYIETHTQFIISAIKYFIYVICGYELLRRTTTKELCSFLFIGAISIIAQILLFNNPLKDYGRYSGLYLNPNVASLICLIGYCLTFSFKGKLRLGSQIVFTLMGLLTFSRTFILLWILINLISIRINVKNAKVFLYGFGMLTVFLIYSEFLPVQNIRLKQLSALVKGESVKSSAIGRDSRTETWGMYYEAIYDHPFLGNGFDSFSSLNYSDKIGVHNMFLKVLGEAGILAFAVFLWFYLMMIRDSLRLFRSSPYIFLAATGLIIFLMTNHDFFNTGYLLFISLWVQTEIEKRKNNHLTHMEASNELQHVDFPLERDMQSSSKISNI